MDHPTAVLAAAALALVCWARPAAACCTTYGRDGRVAIADQEILIVWDAERRFERFVRRAAFETTGSRDFGFLVPTPSKPALAEVPNIVFDRLREATRPKVVSGYTIDFMPLVHSYYGLRSARSRGPADAALEPVRVLDRQTVAGYDAVVLEADDAAALAGWLRTHRLRLAPRDRRVGEAIRRGAVENHGVQVRASRGAGGGAVRPCGQGGDGWGGLTLLRDRPAALPLSGPDRPAREARKGARSPRLLHRRRSGRGHTRAGGRALVAGRRAVCEPCRGPAFSPRDGRKAIPLPLDVLVFLAGGGLWLLRRRGAAAPGPPR